MTGLKEVSMSGNYVYLRFFNAGGDPLATDATAARVRERNRRPLT